MLLKITSVYFSNPFDWLDCSSDEVWPHSWASDSFWVQFLAFQTLATNQKTSKQDYLDETLLFICEYIRPEECDAVGPRLVTFGAKLAPQVLTAQCSPQSPCCTLLCPELSSVNTFPHHWLVKSDASKHLIGWLSIFNFQWVVVVEGDFCFVVLTCTVTSRRMVACVIRVLKIYGGRGK